jgi:hypothetical protein
MFTGRPEQQDIIAADVLGRNVKLMLEIVPYSSILDKFQTHFHRLGMRCNNKESELQSAQAGFLFPIL